MLFRSLHTNERARSNSAGIIAVTHKRIHLRRHQTHRTGTQAAAAAGQLGLYILVTGSDEIAPKVVVTLQDIPAGTQVAAGATIQLQFTDTGVRD